MNKILCLLLLLILSFSFNSFADEYVPRGSYLKLVKNFTINKKKLEIKKQGWECTLKYNKKNIKLKNGSKLKIQIINIIQAIIMVVLSITLVN